jgi:hypothetical protein
MLNDTKKEINEFNEFKYLLQEAHDVGAPQFLL